MSTEIVPGMSVTYDETKGYVSSDPKYNDTIWRVIAVHGEGFVGVHLDPLEPMLTSKSCLIDAYKPCEPADNDYQLEQALATPCDWDTAVFVDAIEHLRDWHDRTDTGPYPAEMRVVDMGALLYMLEYAEKRMGA